MGSPAEEGAGLPEVLRGYDQCFRVLSEAPQALAWRGGTRVATPRSVLPASEFQHVMRPGNSHHRLRVVRISAHGQRTCASLLHSIMRRAGRLARATPSAGPSPLTSRRRESGPTK